jgi:hypothetical protein
MVSLDESECWALLRKAAVGRLAVVVNHRPEIFPITHIVDHATIVFHTAVGTKLEGSLGRDVAFEVDGYDPDTGEAWSVIVKGLAREIKQMYEALEAPAGAEDPDLHRRGQPTGRSASGCSSPTRSSRTGSPPPHVRVPRRPAIQDGQMPWRDIALDPSVDHAPPPDTLLAPATDASYVQLGKVRLTHSSDRRARCVPSMTRAAPRARVINTQEGYCRACGASQAPNQGAAMADKSPRQHMSKKAGKSLKERRADKHAKAAAKNKTEIVPPAKKR